MISLELKIAFTAMLVAMPFMAHMSFTRKSDPVRFWDGNYFVPPLMFGLCMFTAMGGFVAWIWGL